MDFGDILGSLWEAFGSILGSKSRSEFEAIFSSPFLGLTRSDATSAGLQRDFSAGISSADSPQGGALFARGGIL